MLLDVTIGEDSLSIRIEDPFQIDLDALLARIENFASPRGVSISTPGMRDIIPRMIKGIAGCEHGCPADARGVVRAGSREFNLEYIEGGILLATARAAGGKPLHLKMFPDF